ncbi:MAG: DUF87 domain-containing protein [Ruthenibacterium sp.]
MVNELEATQASMNRILSSSLDSATSIITKNYLDRLEVYDLIPPSEEDIDIDVAECGKFYKLTKLVLNKDENFLNKLTTIVNVASSIDCSITTVIRSNGKEVEYYFGVISKNVRGDQEVSRKRRDANAKAFYGALSGNLIGSDLNEISKEEVAEFKTCIFGNSARCYSAVSGIVALRNDEDKSAEGYVQGIENLVDSLAGQQYTIMMIADPVSTSEIQVMKQGYEMLYTQLALFLKNAVTLNESDTLSLAKARTEGITEGISRGVSMTQSQTRSKGSYGGVNASFGINMGLSASIGANMGTNSSTADTNGRTNTTTDIKQQNKAVTNTTSSGKSTGKSLQLTYENRSVQSLLDKIDKQLERLDECESFGAFDCATYVIAANREDALTVASNYNALMRGHDSNIQASHINNWYKPEEAKIVGKYLSAFVHPRFRQNIENDVIVTPASIVSGNEIAIQIGLPKKSISGVTVVPMTPFGRNTYLSQGKKLALGNLYHMGHDDGIDGAFRKVEVDIESLSMHTFITGSTGAGKSTAIYSMLDKLMATNVKASDEKIKFMVIEPAKGEYKERFGSYPDVAVYGTNFKKTPLLKINPFSFPDDIHVLEHIDRLIEIFNVCWPMYAAMPAVLKDAIERAYVVAGWRLDISECKYADTYGNKVYPTFVDVLNQINEVMNESQYSSDSKGDYKGALCTRLKSLTNGLYGQMFAGEEIPANKLFDANVIVDLSRTGSSETKALIMGLLVMKMQEYRIANAGIGNSPLKHITVLEEAHNLLKRTSTEQSGDSSNLAGKSVEMLANSIAEMRTYGEGFIIADQAPGLMDLSVIRNTNTKIILRLPDLADRELVGRAGSLNDEQILELPRLKTFVAVVYQNDWLEPVLCNIETNFKASTPYQNKTLQIDRSEKTKEKLLCFMLIPLYSRNKLDFKYIDGLTKEVVSASIPAEVKVAYLKFMNATAKSEIQRLRGRITSYLFNTDEAFSVSNHYEADMPVWCESMCKSLEPDITMFELSDRQRIVAILAEEQASALNDNRSIARFERLMNFIL